MKMILIILAVIAAAAVGGGLILKVFTDYRNAHYYENAKPGGKIEAKYTAMGPSEVSSVAYDAESRDYGKYEVWYPAEMETSDRTFPLVIMANGTGVKASQYREVFRHLASWGFVVAGNEDENSRTGKSSEAELTFLLEQNEDSGSVFYGKINTGAIGIGGHSQGGVGAVNAATVRPHGKFYRAIWTASATSPFWGREETLGTGWSYDSSKVTVPWLMVAGTGKFDAGTAVNMEETEGQGICPLWGMQEVYASVPDSVPKAMAREIGRDHPEMLRYADGYMTAWFSYWLLGDEEAGGAFLGDAPELCSNPNWQDAAVHIPDGV